MGRDIALKDLPDGGELALFKAHACPSDDPRTCRNPQRICVQPLKIHPVVSETDEADLLSGL
jgi:hypothetical protein